MNENLVKALDKAASASAGQFTVLSTSDHTSIMGMEAGETVEVLATGKLYKLVAVNLPANADSSMAFERLAQYKELFAKASSNGIEVKALAYSQRLVEGTALALAERNVSSIEFATGATILRLPGYTHIVEGSRHTHPEVASIRALLTKRGEDLLRAIHKTAGVRQTTQSLALVATEIAAKAKRTQIHQSVAHRFVGKLRDLELIADAGATGFVLHASGKEQIEQAFPEIFPPSETNDTPPTVTDPTPAQKKSETGATGVGEQTPTPLPAPYVLPPMEYPPEDTDEMTVG